MDNNKETFNYTYSAAQQEEINNIRKKYEAPKEDKMEKLRKLDASATNKACAHSLAIGIIGALIMGTGMSFAMTDIGEALGLQGAPGMILGILVGIIGIVLVCLAYPTYRKTLAKERARIAPEILKLSDEIMKSGN